jgi:hypothetical protein
LDRKKLATYYNVLVKYLDGIRRGQTDQEHEAMLFHIRRMAQDIDIRDLDLVPKGSQSPQSPYERLDADDLRREIKELERLLKVERLNSQSAAHSLKEAREELK